MAYCIDVGPRTVPCERGAFGWCCWGTLYTGALKGYVGKPAFAGDVFFGFVPMSKISNFWVLQHHLCANTATFQSLGTCQCLFTLCIEAMCKYTWHPSPAKSENGPARSSPAYPWVANLFEGRHGKPIRLRRPKSGDCELEATPQIPSVLSGARRRWYGVTACCSDSIRPGPSNWHTRVGSPTHAAWMSHVGKGMKNPIVSVGRSGRGFLFG